MEFIIENTCTLDEIKRQFEQHFPFLKLEFFHPSSIEEGIYSEKNRIKDLDQSLQQISSKSNDAMIFVNSDQSAGSLERQFMDDFGVVAQVFRRSGNFWLLTVASDGWTLKEQNAVAQEHEGAAPEDLPSDFDLYHEKI